MLDTCEPCRFAEATGLEGILAHIRILRLQGAMVRPMIMSWPTARVLAQ